MPHRVEPLRAAFRVSAISVAWTAVASTASIVIGVADHSTVLDAFGAIGFVDAAGSVALAHHFRHALRHERFSERLEQRAQRVVIVGLVAVGLAAIVLGGARLLTGTEADSSPGGVAIAGVSVVVLARLSRRKLTLAPQVDSAALRSDGHLSAIGATQAAVTLLGTLASAVLGAGWVDSVAAMTVGAVAVAVGATTARSG